MKYYVLVQNGKVVTSPSTSTVDGLEGLWLEYVFYSGDTRKFVKPKKELQIHSDKVVEVYIEAASKNDIHKAIVAESKLLKNNKLNNIVVTFKEHNIKTKSSDLVPLVAADIPVEWYTLEGKVLTLSVEDLKKLLQIVVIAEQNIVKEYMQTKYSG